MKSAIKLVYRVCVTFKGRQWKLYFGYNLPMTLEDVNKVSKDPIIAHILKLRKRR